MKVYTDGTELIELNQSQNQYQMTGLTLGQVLKTQVSALNEIGESNLSPSRMLVFANLPDKPASITLTPTNGQRATLLIQWQAPSSTNGDPVSTYKVYLDNGRGGPFTLIFEGVPSSYSYEAGVTEELDCGYLYMVRISASNVAGEGAYISGSAHLGNTPSNPKTP